jgi:hypothetical protein
VGDPFLYDSLIVDKDPNSKTYLMKKIDFLTHGKRVCKYPYGKKENKG